MKNRLIAFAIICITGMSTTALKAQELPFEAFLKKLSAYTSANAQEKVYLHLDKPYYAIGDDIWFKAYTINAKTGQPSLTSNLIYVELINEKDSVNRQLKLPMNGGITWGDFKLTDSLAEGNYRIRAYTQWMRNASPDFFFDKTIKVGNSWANKVFTKSNNVIKDENSQQSVTTNIQFTDKQNMPYQNAEVNYEVKLGTKSVERGKTTTNSQGEINISFINKQPQALKSGFIYATLTLPNKQKITKEIPLKSTSKDIDVQFFPEGGNLVENLPNKVAIKATNANGLGEITKGVIINSEGVEISQFETNKLGMGTFFLNPESNVNYKVKATFTDGSEKTLDLPKAQKSGAVLAVNNADSTKMQIKVYLSEDLLKGPGYHLVAHHNGAVYFETTLSTTKQVVSLTVAKDSLPSGITTISLLTKNFLPVAERIVFVNNIGDKIQVWPNILKKQYNRRDKVDINFIATEGQKKPVIGSFSVAVTNTTAVKPDQENESNILTKLLLTSDLVGYVEKPNHYFLNNDATTRSDLDNLLLTQGWRKLNWKEVNNPASPTFEPEKRLQISGKVTKGGKPVVKGKISLVSFSGGFFMTDTLTDDKGRFNFDKIEFPDSTKFVVQARTDKDKKFVDIEMDIVPGQVVTKNPNTGDIEVNINEALAGYLQQSGKYFEDLTNRGLLNRTILLDAVTIVEKRKQEINSSNLNGAGNADAVITAKDLEMSTSLSQYLQGRVAGVNIMNGQAFSRGNQNPMSIYIDGMNYGGEDVNLDDIVVNDIETVEVLKSAANTAIYGMRGGSGVIVITTKSGQGIRSAVNTYTPGLVRFNPKGYAVSRQFYSPKYDIKPDSRPDYRTTVYWNPQVVTDATGKASFSFFNTDVPGDYRVVIEGIDAYGNLARKILNYEVK